MQPFMNYRNNLNAMQRSSARREATLPQSSIHLMSTGEYILIVSPLAVPAFDIRPYFVGPGGGPVRSQFNRGAACRELV